MLYEIVIRGYIRDTWFEEFSVMEQSNLTTVIRGEILDQSALYGILRRINDLGLNLISVNFIKE